MKLADYTEDELLAEIRRRNKQNSQEERMGWSSDAANVLAKMFFENSPSNVTFDRTDHELFDQYGLFELPSIPSNQHKPEVYAIETVNDAEEAPWIEVADYTHHYLFDKNGEIVARASVISLPVIPMVENPLAFLSESFDAVSEEWSWFFQHPFFVNTPEDTEAILFIETIDVEKEYRGVGLGKWLMGVVAKHFIGHNTYAELLNDRIALGVVPFPIRDEPGDFAEREALLIDWYKHIFKCFQKTDDFRKTKNFLLKEDIGSPNSSSILYWSAGGKKKYNQ